MIIGTAHFVDKAAADKYYSYGYSPSDVSEKIKNGEIFIGAPKINPGQKLGVYSGEGRYFIEG